MSIQTSIELKCPICVHNHSLESPEVLCGHMAQFHDMNTVMQWKSFESFAHFQIWLSVIEDSRCDGGYLGSSQGPYYEDEYYLLCRRRPSSSAKRRRMSDEQSSGNNTSLVSCTAFVHVFEAMDGRVTVRYCLDHCGHSDEETQVKRMSEPNAHSNCRKRSTLKRTSPCANFEPSDEDFPIESSSLASSPASSIDFEDDEIMTGNNNSLKPEQLDDQLSVSSMNMFISQRLDTTADRLRALTKVLADLAMDISNADNRHIPMVI